MSYIEIRQENTDQTKENDMPPKLDNTKISRNAICPLCDSGKKYKHCCGRF